MAAFRFRVPDFDNVFQVDIAGDKPSPEEMARIKASVSRYRDQQRRKDIPLLPSVLNELEAGGRNYAAGMADIGGAMGIDGAARWAKEQHDKADALSQESALPQSYKDVDGIGSGLGYLTHLGVQSLPYLGEFAAAASTLGGSEMALGAGRLAARGLGSRAIARETAALSAKGVAEKEAAGLAAEKVAQGYARTGAGVVGTYPSSLGAVLSAQQDQNGQYNPSTAVPLALLYAPLNALGIEGLIARGVPKAGAGRFATGIMTGAESMLSEGGAEGLQQGLEEAGRASVDPNYDPLSPEAKDRYIESLIGGAALGGGIGAVTGAASNERGRNERVEQTLRNAKDQRGASAMRTVEGLLNEQDRPLVPTAIDFDPAPGENAAMYAKRQMDTLAKIQGAAVPEGPFTMAPTAGGFEIRGINGVIMGKPARTEAEARDRIGVYDNYGLDQAVGVAKKLDEMKAGKIPRAYTPGDVHALAGERNILTDQDPAFMDFSERLTGKRHLDDMDPADVAKVGQALETYPRYEKPTPISAARPVTTMPESLVPKEEPLDLTAADEAPMDLAASDIVPPDEPPPPDNGDQSEPPPPPPAGALLAPSPVLTEGMPEAPHVTPPPVAAPVVSEDTGGRWKVDIGGTVYRGDQGKPFTSKAQADAFAATRAPEVIPAKVKNPPLVVPEGDGTKSAPMKIEAPEHLDTAVSQIAAPTEAQKESGNYKKAHVKMGGLDVTVENGKGSTRSGKDPDGNEWSVEMPAHYGYVKGTKAADGEQFDVYLGDNPKADKVWVVDQIDPKTGKFDEHKALLGFDTQDQALATYDAAFSDGSGPARRGAVTEMGQRQFRDLVKKGTQKKPLAYGKPQKVQPAAFDTAPHLDTVRAYVNQPDKPSLQFAVVGKKHGLTPNEARAVLIKLASEPNSGLYVTRPKKDKDVRVMRKIARPTDHVLAFLASKGGIRNDENHDLIKGRGLQYTVPGYGPLIRKTGMSIDEAGEALHEAGFFGPPETTPRPTEDEVLQLLERTAGGKKIYPPERQAEVDAENAAKRDMALEQEMRADITTAAADRNVTLTDADRSAILDIMLANPDLTADEAVVERLEATAAEWLDKDSEANPDGQYDADEEIWPPLETEPARGDSEAGAGIEGSQAAAGEPDGQSPGSREPEKAGSLRPEEDVRDLSVGDVIGAAPETDEARAARKAKEKAERAQAEVRVLQQQSKMRRVGQQSVGDQAGGLFSNEQNQNDIFGDDEIPFSLTDAANVRQVEYAPEFQEAMRDLQAALRQRLDGYGLKDIGLRLVRALPTSGKGKVGEGLFVHRLIAIAQGIADPNLSTGQQLQQLAAVLDHETIHALRHLDLFTEGEWNALVYKAKQTKRAGDPKGRSFHQEAVEKYSKIPHYAGNVELLNQEAVAEMFRAHANGTLPLAGQPRSLFERIRQFFRRFGEVLNGRGFKTPEQVFRNIQSGKIGGRERGKVRTLREFQNRTPVRRASPATNAADFDQRIEDRGAGELDPRMRAAAHPDLMGRAGASALSTAVTEAESHGATADFSPGISSAGHGSSTASFSFPAADQNQIDSTAAEVFEGAKGRNLPFAYVAEESAPGPNTRPGIRIDGPVDAATVARLKNELPGDFDISPDGIDYVWMPETAMKPEQLLGFNTAADLREHLDGQRRQVEMAAARAGVPVQHYNVLSAAQGDFDAAIQRLRGKHTAYDPAGNTVEHEAWGQSPDTLVLRRFLHDHGWEAKASPEDTRRIRQHLTDLWQREYAPFENEADTKLQHVAQFKPGARGLPSVLMSLGQTAQPQTETEAFKRWFGDSKVVDEHGKPLVVYHGTTSSFDQFQPGSYFTADHDEAGAYTFHKELGARERATGKYRVISQPDLAGKRLEYWGTLSDIDRPVKGRFYATDNGVFRSEGNGRWAVVNDIVLGDYNEATDTIRVVPGDARAEAQEVVDEYEAFVQSRFPGGDGGNVMPVYLSIKNPKRMSALEGNRLGRRVGADDASVTREIAALKAQGYDGIVTESDDAYFAFNPSEPRPTHYIPFDPEQIKSAIGNRGTFDAADPRILFSYVDEDPNFTQTANDAMNKVSGRSDNMTFGQSIINATRMRPLMWFRQKAIDKYAKIDENAREMAKIMGDEWLQADMSAAAAAYLSDRANGFTAAAIKKGIPKIIQTARGGAYTKIVDGGDGGLIDIFKPLYADPNGNLVRQWHAYAIALREERFASEGRAVLTTPAERRAIISEVQRLYPQIVDTHQKYQRYSGAVAQYLVDTGVIAQGQKDLWVSSNDYVPFYRQLEGDETAGPTLFHGLFDVKAPKRAKGSDSQKVDDPIETIGKNLQAAITAGMKNVAAQRAINDAVALGQAQDVPKQRGTHTVRFNGKERHFQVFDPLLLDAMVHMFDGKMIGLEILGKPASLLRELVTRDPGFMLANMLRDTAAAWGASGARFIPVVDTAINFGREAGNVLTGNTSTLMEQLEALGVTGGYDFAADPKDLKKYFERQMQSQKALKRSPWDKFRLIWDKTGEVTTASDVSTRMAIYKDVLRKSGSEAEAAYQALELMNFGRRGSSPVMRYLTAMIPFLNARIQGLDVIYRALTGRYSAHQTNNRSAIMMGMLLRGATMMALTAGYYSLVHDDDDWKRQTAEAKDDYYVIPVGNGHDPITLPIAFEWGVLTKVIPERLMAYFSGAETGRDLSRSITRAITSTLEMNPLKLQFAAPIIEASMNHSFFTGREIIPYYLDENMAPVDKERAQTSPTARMIARGVDAVAKATGAFGANEPGVKTPIDIFRQPMTVESMIRGYTGTLGTYALQMMDGLTRAVTGAPEMPSRRPDQWPVLSRFLNAADSGGFRQQFYDMRGAVQEIVATMNSLEKAGKTDEMASYYRRNGWLYEMKDTINDIDNDLSDIRKQVEAVWRSDMSGPEKRAALEALQQVESNTLAFIPELRTQVFGDMRRNWAKNFQQ